ncbi:hypothetical protein RRG08_053186 [Elysia crispata]|uniref:Uncharacterized protein n=1 Tax=Elysia crispata TaxID=231223 RepID=A0AAE1D3Q5_9GAST|nr:hypothetical protein RRG08_053186 [Elysia crispata]
MRARGPGPVILMIFKNHLEPDRLKMLTRAEVPGSNQRPWLRLIPSTSTGHVQDEPFITGDQTFMFPVALCVCDPRPTSLPRDAAQTTYTAGWGREIALSPEFEISSQGDSAVETN